TPSGIGPSMTKLTIDLNADLGESGEALANGTDFELMRYITSANIACGGHAGDERTMRETVAAAKKLNVAVGAHPGYPDCVADTGRGFAGRGCRTREAAWRALSRGAQESRGCTGSGSRRASNQSDVDRGRSGRLTGSGSMAFDGIALRR